MEKIEIINEIEYLATYDENGELMYRYIKSDEQGETMPPEPVDPLTLPTTKGDIKELNELITENTIEVQYMSGIMELGL